MSINHRPNSSDDRADHTHQADDQPTRRVRPIGDKRTYRVTSRRRDEIDIEKYVAALTRYVIAQAEADAEHRGENQARERGGTAESGGDDE